jgi:putative pyruvate formate lyase activating enzyme
MQTDEALRLAKELLNPCQVCPRLCLVNRLVAEMGFCRGGALVRVASAGAHFGEEPVLVGKGGSGAIFFEGCNLHCVYCQNCLISRGNKGAEMDAARLAGLMCELEASGCVNVNLVTPTHFAPQILEAILIARGRGLKVPIVYNCGGYELVEMLSLLDGHIQIYMPDFKYASAEAGQKYSKAIDYPGVARSALAEMYRQVGPLKVNKQGLATSGVLVRHLVLPMDAGDVDKVVDVVAQIAPGCGINIMGQYRPAFHAADFPELLVLPGPEKVPRARKRAEKAGLHVIS